MMNVHRLKNLISLRTRNISKRIQKALQELSENLSNESQQLQPQPIPIPIKNNGRRLINNQFKRYYGTYSGFNNGFHTGFKFNCHFKFHNIKFQQCKFLKFYHRASNIKKPSKIFQSLNKGFLFNNFSQTYQSSYRLKLFNSNVKLTYRTLFNFPRFTSNNSDRFENKFKPTVRLNLSLTPSYHRLTLAMARTDSTASYAEKLNSNQLITGCYIEFPINFNFNIPNETIFSQEILNEMIDDLNIVQKRIEELKNDLMNLFELGELPIKYIASRNVVRVYFPNCDKAKLESLCKEKNIKGGIIYEDIEGPEPISQSISTSSSDVNQDDILSSYYNSNSSMSSLNSSDDDILSNSLIHPLSNDEIVRIDEQINQLDGHINVNEYDEFYWVSSA